MQQPPNDNEVMVEIDLPQAVEIYRHLCAQYECRMMSLHMCTGHEQGPGLPRRYCGGGTLMCLGSASAETDLRELMATVVSHTAESVLHNGFGELSAMLGRWSKEIEARWPGATLVNAGVSHTNLAGGQHAVQ